ncbi:DoxX family protein [Luteolibacter sp. LG18]|uniref:DoxX family protein n=1 Tax=Luteolibacter sp. LG18 TaxID=2819286 RepID=UPI002B2FD1AD|nr:putative membrane protein [Luteolibacter sp. LG18]
MNACLAKLCTRLRGLEAPGRDAVLLFLRLTIGAQFFLTGKGKLAHLDKVSGFFESLHIPAPHFHAVLVANVEMIGGLLLVLGLATRLAAVPLTVSMVVAYLTAHLNDVLHPEDAEGATGLSAFLTHVSAFIDQKPFPFLIVCLVLLAFGAGRISLDHLIGKRCCRTA